MPACCGPLTNRKIFMSHPAIAGVERPSGDAAAQPQSADQSPPAIVSARAEALEKNLAYAGSISPQDSWDLVSRGLAVLVDVRSAEERKFVGQVPNSVHVAWATGTALTRNPRFVRELESKVRKDQLAILLCRSGKRSVLAAEAAAKAGFTQIFNVLEGFEGELDADQQRGKRDGWRLRGLPWIQD
jgi:rhodanese-related sulfurtransferase